LEGRGDGKKFWGKKSRRIGLGVSRECSKLMKKKIASGQRKKNRQERNKEQKGTSNGGRIPWERVRVLVSREVEGHRLKEAHQEGELRREGGRGQKREGTRNQLVEGWNLLLNRSSYERAHQSGEGIFCQMRGIGKKGKKITPGASSFKKEKFLFRRTYS